MRHKVGLAIGVVALAALSGASDRDFSLTLEPLFLGTESPGRVQPYAMTVENRGRDTSGEIALDTNEFSMRYPVDLPQGSRKRIVAYLTGGNYFQGMATLRTPLGGAQFKLESRPTGNMRCVAVISDVAGELGFLRTNTGRDQPTVDVYIKPGLLPERTVAYVGVNAIWLGDGAERMNDEAAAAIRRYVTSGGTLVVSGGASMPLMGDARWQPLLPVLGAQPRTVRLDSQVWGMSIQGACTVGAGTLSPGASARLSVDNVPVVVEKRHGLGRVVYIAMNITEGPAKQWLHRDVFIQKTGILEPSPLAQLVDTVDPDPYGGSPAPYTTSPGFTPMANSPFSARVPETGTVLGILFLYFLIVVPINLFALRKVGKGELAWISSPIISLAFAAVFFRFSAGLYAANLSVSSSGTIVMHQGDPEATYLGHTQLFFPRGGRYDLKLDGVESVFTREVYSGNPNQISTMASLSMWDDGQIRATDSSVTNLAFREFSLLQRVKVKDLVAVKVNRRGGKVVSVSLTNRSPYLLEQTGVILGDGSMDVGTLKPGETKESHQSGYMATEAGPTFAVTQVTQSALMPPGRHGDKGALAAVTGLISGFPVGPQVGLSKDTVGRNWLVYTFREEAP